MTYDESFGEKDIIPGLETVKPSKSIIYVGYGTPLACTSCHRTGMEFYYLKRSNGKYDVLCFDNGKGCWEHSCRSLCSYIDIDAAQCTDLSEWMVIYGAETDLSRKAVCARHVPAVLSNSSSYRIYPIDAEIS